MQRLREIFPIVLVLFVAMAGLAVCSDDDTVDEESDPLDCQDGIDNDGDSLTDCDDPDCGIHTWCMVGWETSPTDCRDATDNDDDGLTDCDDPGCSIHDYCTICPGCLIWPTCFQDDEVNPQNDCEICDTSRATDAWSDHDGALCFDGVFCNGADTCAGNTCTIHSGNPCQEGETCDENTGCN